MKNKIVKIMLTIVLFGLFTKVDALSEFPSTFTTSAEGTSVTLNNNHSLEIDTSQTVGSTHNYPYFHVKNSSAGNIICVSGLGENEPVSGLTCNQVSWSDAKQAKGVAYIINTIIGTGGSATVSNEKYFWSEVLINDYLGTYSPSDNSYMSINVINNSSVKIASTGKTYKEILSGATSYANADYSASLSANRTSVTFTLSGDYYVSTPVTITSSTTASVTLNNSKFETVKDGNTYTFKIKSSDVTLGSSESFTATIKNSGKEYYTAQRYDCGGSYQDLTLSQTVKKTGTGDSITISGSVSKSTVEIKVAKVDSEDKYIPGAKLHFQTAAERSGNKDGKIITSTSSYTTISNLTAGTYYLTEKEAPKGYETSKEVIKIEIDNSGNIKVNGKSAPSIIKIKNDLTQVKISKIDSKSKQPIIGSLLQVLDKDGNAIKDDSGNVLYKWRTDGKEYIINGLPAGKYKLKELESPEGYVLNKTMKEFEVKADGSGVVTVIMTNTKNRVVINKISMVDKKLLPGATLEIQDEEGKIVKYCKDDSGKNIECKWVTDDEAYEIEGMPIGTYYLVETAAPKGYVLSKEKVKFVVDNATPVIKVEMKNELEVEVPDTLSARSTLLLAIAMFDIALGIGIITYVKKNKVQE